MESARHEGMGTDCWYQFVHHVIKVSRVHSNRNLGLASYRGVYATLMATKTKSDVKVLKGQEGICICSLTVKHAYFVAAEDAIVQYMKRVIAQTSRASIHPDITVLCF